MRRLYLLIVQVSKEGQSICNNHSAALLHAIVNFLSKFHARLRRWLIIFAIVHSENALV